MSIFNQLTDRTPFFSVKYEVAHKLGNEDTLPFWIADMDLPVAEPIVNAIKERASHPYFGYTSIDPKFYTSFASWHTRRHGTPMDPELLAPAQNVVHALLHILALDADEGDGVIVQPPVYFPFFSIIEKLKLNKIDNPLVLKNGRYEMDFDDLEDKLKKENARYLIFCSPHNPVGRVWSKEELTTLVDLCYAHDVHILSDEIHSDLILKGKHIPLHTLNEKARQITTSFYSSGKTFNLASLHSAYIYMRNKEQKQAYLDFEKKWEIPLSQIFGMVANIAAFSECETWYQDMIAHLKDNVRLVKTFVKEHLSPIKLIDPEATFLLWLDCRELGLDAEELNDFFLNEANILLNRGDIFGSEGSGFMRMNIATPRARLEEGLRRVEQALHKRRR